LRGFKPNKVYRFYCVRVSEQGLYPRSVDITCVDGMYRYNLQTNIEQRFMKETSIKVIQNRKNRFTNESKACLSGLTKPIPLKHKNN
jgi:hypothetical protein